MKKVLLTIAALLCTFGAMARGIEFSGDYKTAEERARKSGKPLFVALLAKDNKLSQQIAENVFTDPEVGARYNSTFVPVLLWDDAPGAREIFADYGFSFYPALLFLSPEGDFLKKTAGYKDADDMLALAGDYRDPQADRLAELRRKSEAGDRDALGKYLELASTLGVRNTKALVNWLADAPEDAATFALIEKQNPEVGSVPFGYLVAHTDQLAAATGGNGVDIYIYNKYFDHLRLMHSGRQGVINALKKAGYKYTDALSRHLALSSHIDGAAGDAATRARIDALTEEYPVTAVKIGDRLWRRVTKKDPAFEEYVAGFLSRLAEWSPMDAVNMALYIVNNYLIVNADVLAADPWVDRYLAWSGAPNYEPKITRTVKQATGEWPCDDYGRVMPDIELRTLDGETMRVSDLRGGFVLIDFWASWCGPCKAEIPHVKEAYEKVKGSPVRFVSISSDTNDEAWRKAAKEIDVPWLHLSSKGTDMLKQYKVHGIPRIMVIDPEGRLVADNITGRTIEIQLRRLAEKYGWRY